jgi:hypothetical protein
MDRHPSLLGISSSIAAVRKRESGGLQCNLIEDWSNIQFEVIQYAFNHVSPGF